jgi:hypothetical protein
MMSVDLYIRQDICSAYVLQGHHQSRWQQTHGLLPEKENRELEKKNQNFCIASVTQGLAFQARYDYSQVTVNKHTWHYMQLTEVCNGMPHLIGK